MSVPAPSPAASPPALGRARRGEIVALDRAGLLRVVRDRHHARAAGERDHANERVVRLRVEALLDLGARVLEARVGDGVGDVDEVDGAHLLRRRGPRQSREPEREQRDEGRAEDHADHPLRDRQIRQRARDHPHEVRCEEPEPQHARREELVRLAVPRPRQRRPRVPDEAEVGPQEGRPQRHDERAERDSLRPLVHTVSLR